MAKTRDDYTAANRLAWDASAPHHEAGAAFAALLEGFARPGFDQSGAFLAQARRLAAAGNIDCDFVEADVYKIPATYDGAFDLVLITIGAFGWMPDLGAFFAVIERLLRPGGALLVYEQHPIMNMFEPTAADPMKPVHSYFRTEPFEDTGAILYDGTPDVPGETQYWFVHKLSDIISAALAHGLALEHFLEYPHNISSAEFDVYNGQEAQLPVSYLLVARKGA